MKDRIRRIPRTLLTALPLILLVGCFVLPEEEKALGPPVMKPPEVEYNTVPVERKDISRQVYLYGHLISAVDKELFFRYQGGRLTRLMVQLGDEVQKGQLLAELDLGNLLIQLKQRQIGLERAQLYYDMKKASNAGKFDLRLAELDIQLARLQLDDTEARIADARLVSPIDGTVVNIQAKEGGYVAAFQPIVRVVDPKDLILECGADTDSEYFYTGMDVDAILKGETVVGKIIRSPRDSFLDASGPQAGADDVVLIELPRIPEGASLSDIGRVILTLEKQENTVVLAKNLIQRYGGRTYVNVLKDGFREERFVEIGIETSNEVEIVSGLEEGELVIRE